MNNNYFDATWAGILFIGILCLVALGVWRATRVGSVSKALPKARSWSDPSVPADAAVSLDDAVGARLRDALAGTGQRLVVVHGAPGTGKHRLGAAAIRAVLPEYRVFAPRDGADLAAFARYGRLMANRLVIWIGGADLVCEHATFSTIRELAGENGAAASMATASGVPPPSGCDLAGGTVPKPPGGRTGRGSARDGTRLGAWIRARAARPRPRRPGDRSRPRDVVVLVFLGTDAYQEAKLTLTPSPPVDDPLGPMMLDVAWFIRHANAVQVPGPEPGDDEPISGPTNDAGWSQRQALEAWYGGLPQRSKAAKAIVDVCVAWRRLGLPPLSRRTLHAIWEAPEFTDHTASRRRGDQQEVAWQDDHDTLVGSGADFARALELVQETVGGTPIVRDPHGAYQVAEEFFRLRCAAHHDIPEPVWVVAIRHSSGQQAYQLGIVARKMSRYRHAIDAFEKANKSRIPDADYLLAVVLAESGRLQPALDLFEKVLRAVAADARTEHGMAKQAVIQVMRASLTGWRRTPRDAVHELASLIAAREVATGHSGEAIGTSARRELYCLRHYLYRWQCEAGVDLDTALAELSQLAREQEQQLPDDRASALAVRYTIAVWTSRMDGGVLRRDALQSASTLFDELVAAYELAVGIAHPASYGARNDLLRVRAELAVECGDRTALREVTKQLVALEEQAVQRLGPRDLRTLRIRENLAWWQAEDGNLTKAIESLRRLRADSVATLGETHEFSVSVRQSLARCLVKQPSVAITPGALTNLEAAVKELEAVVGVAETTLTKDHPRALRARRELACLRGRRDPDRACRELREILALQEETQPAEATDIQLTRDALERCAGSRLVHLMIQPVYRSARRVVGYEVLFSRKTAQPSPVTRQDVAATSSVILNTFTTFGIGTLAEGLDLFITVPEDFVRAALPIPVEPGRVVLELPTPMTFDERAMLGLKRLTEQGIRIGMGMTEWADDYAEVLPYLTYVMIDLSALDEETAGRLATECRARSNSVALVGQRIGERAQLEAAERLGCQLFQGDYFARPLSFSRKPLPSSAVSRVRLISALAEEPTPDRRDIIRAVEGDPDLSSKVVQWANSAEVAPVQPVSSIADAISLMGDDRLRALAALAAAEALPETNEGSLVSMLTWSHLCRVVAEQRGVAGGKGYLAGLTSEIADYLGRPAMDVAVGLHLTDELREAVANYSGPLGDVVKIVKTYKSGGIHATTPPVANAQLRDLHMEAFINSAHLVRTI